MKTALFALLLLLASTAHAADFEASLGKSANTVNMAYSLGITGLLSDNLRWRAGYANLGKQQFERAAVPSAAADDIAAGEGPGPYTWTAAQNETELYATLAPEMHRGNWIFSIEGGLGVYKPIWNQDLMAGASVDPHSTPIALTPILGASIGYGKTSLVFSYQRIKTAGDNDSMMFRQTQEILSIRQRF